MSEIPAGQAAKRPFDDESAEENKQANQSTEENKQANQSTDTNCQSASLKSLTLDLKWSERNKIINNLYAHTSFLYRRISPAEKDHSENENFQLIKTLLNLPSSSYPNKANNKRFKVDEKKPDEKRSNEIILDLAWKDRDLILDNLTQNHHGGVRFSNQVSAEIKENLVAENNKLITILTNLKVRNGLDLAEVESEVEEELDGGDKQSEKEIPPKENGADNSTEPANVSVLALQLAEFKKVLDEMKEKGTRSETCYNWRVPVSKLVEKLVPIVSPSFNCGGIQWTVQFDVRSNDGKDYLSVFVKSSSNPLGGDVNVEFKLLNHIGLGDYKKTLEYTQCVVRAKPVLRGYSEFIECDALLDRNRGFVNPDNDVIELEIYLQVTNKAFKCETA